MSRSIRSFLTLMLLAAGLASEAQQLVPTRGKEFWMGFMQNYLGTADMILYISSDVATTGTVSMPLNSWTQNFTVNANSVTQVELPASAMNQGSEVVTGLGVHIETEDTVAVYALNFQPATADAAVIYPVKSLGTDYRVQAFYGLIGFDDLKSELLIVATADDTEIEITPSCNTAGGQLANVPFTIVLDQGQTYQVQGATAALDLTGTKIVGTAESGSCRPFAVYSGSVCPDVPEACFACDHVFDQNMPTDFWGTTYYSVPWQGTTSYLYRVLADDDNTQVSINGAPPIVLNAGQFYEDENSTGPVCFTGNQPFCVAQFMKGQDCSGGQGDPALLILNPEEQKINDITFATVVSPNITTQSINIIVDIVDIGGVVLDGQPVNAALFTPFASCPDHAHATMALNQGSHRVSCFGGLTGYVYGLGPNYETYAYSVGSFTPLPPLNYDTVYCGLDSTDWITLSPPVPIFNPVWTTESEPLDTLFEGLSYTFQPDHTDVYVVTGSENISGCEQQYFFSIEMGDAPATSIVAPATVCAYTPVQIDLQLTPNGTYVYEWTPESGLNNANVQDPIATPSHDTWYHVTVSSVSGCVSTVDSVLVTVTPGDVTGVQASAVPQQICVGNTAQLDVSVMQIIAQDDINNGIGPFWDQVNGGLPDNVCGSVSGDALYFNLAGTRSAWTTALDVSGGGQIRFAIKIATGLAPCEDVDVGENILLEFSTNGGNSWSLIATYFESQFPEFTDVVVPIPPPAQTIATMFRWRQLSNSGLGQDNWMLDDVAIAADDNTGIVFDWTPSATLNNASISDPIATPPSTIMYTVNIIDQQTTCPYVDSIEVLVGPNFTLEVTDDTVFCSFAFLTLEADPVQNGNYSWTWLPNDGSLSSTNIMNPSASVFQTTEYFVTVTNDFGCVIEDSVTVTIADALTASIFVTPNPVCQGEPAQLQVQAFGGSGSYTYSWNPPQDLNNASIPNPLATPPSSTNYVATITDQLCGQVVQEQIFLTILPAPQVDLGPDQIICPGESTTLDAGPATSWLWSTNAVTQAITVSTPGEYWVAASNGICPGRDTVWVNIAPDPGTLGFTTTNCDDRAITIEIPYDGGTYLWYNDSTTQSITVNGTGQYAFELTDTYGCTYNDVISVILDPLGLGVTVPNVFSPNGDGKNDQFEPQANGSDKVEVTIFNRWGQEVFYAQRMNTLWDGSETGNKAPEGTYYYVVKFTPTCENIEQTLKGHVTVLR